MNQKRGVVLRQDSRDLHFHLTFGSDVSIPTEANFDVEEVNVIEPDTSVACTAISDCDVATDQTKIIYDYNDLFNLTPHGQFGADPRDTLGVMITKGLKPIDGTVRDTRWVSYFRGDTNPIFDAFDSVRSTMTIAQSSITFCTNWYDEWNRVLAEGIMPLGQKIVSTHDCKICGWTMVQGEVMVIIKAWQGYKMYMPRAVFNKAVTQWGCGTYMPSTMQMDMTRQKTFLEWIRDFATNAVLLLRQLLIFKKNNTLSPMSPPVESTVIPSVEVTEIVTPVAPQYLWDTLGNIQHSMRMIGDTFNMSMLQKDLLCDICGCESGFNITAKRVNSPTSIDRGLFQWNNKYHPEITDAIAYNPEEATKLACKAIVNKQTKIFWSASEPCWNINNKYSTMI